MTPARGSIPWLLVARGASHALWHESRVLARLLGVIALAGFQRRLTELGQILANPGSPDMAAIGALAGCYGPAMYPERLPAIMETYGARLG